jgi:hypothetical protein
MEPGFRRMFDAAEIEYIRKMNIDMVLQNWIEN